MVLSLAPGCVASRGHTPVPHGAHHHQEHTLVAVGGNCGKNSEEAMACLSRNHGAGRAPWGRGMDVRPPGLLVSCRKKREFPGEGRLAKGP